MPNSTEKFFVTFGPEEGDEFDRVSLTEALLEELQYDAQRSTLTESIQEGKNFLGEHADMPSLDIYEVTITHVGVVRRLASPINVQIF